MVNRRILAGASLVAALAVGVVAPVSAQAATAPRGAFSSAGQYVSNHRVVLRGWAYDPRKPSASVVVDFYVAGASVGHVTTTRPSPGVNKKYGITGRHAFTFSYTPRHAIPSVTALTRGVATTGRETRVAVHAVTQVDTNVGARVVSVAKTFVGKARYVEGGASPSRGFDCSGYTQYVYAQAKAGKLPHNAEAQRRLLHHVSAAAARPGDLVFYLSGGSAYHVAIYAGHHMQYAAATVRDGIRYQQVWSSSVVYGHLG